MKDEFDREIMAEFGVLTPEAYSYLLETWCG